MWEVIANNAGTAVIVLIILYFFMKHAVRSAIEDSQEEIAKAVKDGIEEYEQGKRQAGLGEEEPEEEESEEE